MRRAGAAVGIVPGHEVGEANEFCTHVVATGIGHARNLAVVSSGEAVIAIGGEWGTLSEIGFARTIGRPVIVLRSWALTGREKMADAPGVVPAESAGEAVELALESLRVSGHDDSIRAEFTHQSSSFGTAAAMTSAETLGALVELVPEDTGAEWVDLACGPGVVTRAIAGRVGSVRGFDLTPAMVAEAERRAREEGVGNVDFAVGDATATGLPDASFDGAITRLSLHHIPGPARVVAEMARLVRPGGCVLVSDIAADSDGEAAVWREEIERLRDPSHWACVTPERLRSMGEAARLKLESERLVPIEIDYEDWLARGSGGLAAARLIDELFAQRPESAEGFCVTGAPGARRLHQRYWLGRWRRPA